MVIKEVEPLYEDDSDQNNLLNFHKIKKKRDIEVSFRKKYYNDIELASEDSHNDSDNDDDGFLSLDVER